MIIAACVGFWFLSGLLSIALLLHAEPIGLDHEKITLLDLFFMLWFIIFGPFSFGFVLYEYGSKIVVWKRRS